MDLTNKTIHGHYDLELIPETLYDIHYGIHQGVYKYLGQESEGFWKGAYMFINEKNGMTFNHYASHPYEFTLIVKKH